MMGASSAEGESKVDVQPLTPVLLDTAQAFLRQNDVTAYLLPRAPTAELLQRALGADSRSKVLIWFASNVVIGMSGLTVTSDASEAELWCIATSTEKHWWVVKTAVELMLREAFDAMKLHSVRVSCIRSDALTISALRDSGMIEEGVQRSSVYVKGNWEDRTLFGMVRSDWDKDEAARQQHQIYAQSDWEDRFAFYALLIPQGIGVAVLCYLAWLAASGWFSLVVDIATIGAVVSIDVSLIRQIRAEERIGPRPLQMGALCAFLLSLLLVLQTCYRINWSAGFSMVWLLPVLLITFLLIVHFAAVRQVRNRRIPWLWLGAFMVFFPTLSMWVQLSGSAMEWTMTTPMVEGRTNWRKERNARDQVINERKSWQRDVPARVAVALSGGGYRAALIHAGVLAALDSRHVPIRYLTTVSGGSIIGASYALGYSPAEFIQFTREHKPGLALDKLSAYESLSSWFLPGSSDADVYANHFARSYFGGATLHDLPDSPILLVNATDIEAAPVNAREIFFRDIAERDPPLARSIRVADVVAASGAFPVAFEPKTIRWFAPGKEAAPQTVVPRRFVDGGVVENLGLEGLKRYLRLRDDLKLEIHKPDVLIVSDASLPNTTTALPRKPELIDLMTRVQNISYDAYQRTLLSQFTGQTDYWRWMSERDFPFQYAEVPYEQIDATLDLDEPRVLHVIIIPATSPQLEMRLQKISVNQCNFRGRSIADVQREVARYNTLEELDPKQVEASAWLGAALVNLYWDAIQCSIYKSANPEAVCALKPSALPLCPRFEDIARENYR